MGQEVVVLVFRKLDVTSRRELRRALRHTAEPTLSGPA